MALPNNLKLKVNIDDLRADPNIIQDYEDSIQAILDDVDGKKLVDIDTLRAYDKALKGSDIGETFDTLKEIQTGIETEMQDRKEAITKLEKKDLELEGRLDVIEGEEDGSIKKTIATAVEYLENYADQTESDAIDAAKAYTNEVIGDKANGETPATGIRKEIADAIAIEAQIREVADQIATNNLAKEVQTLNEKDAALVAEDSKLAGLIDQNKTAIEREESERQAAENALDARLDKVEKFFEGAYTEDGKPIRDALDTLIEIQTYVDAHGEVADKMIKDIAQNTGNINSLTATKLDKATYEAYVATHALTDDELATMIDKVDARFTNYVTSASYATDKAGIEQAIADANTARSEADAGFETRIAALEANFGDGEGTVEAQIAAAVKAEEDARKEAIKGVQDEVDAVEGRMDTAEGKIAGLEDALALKADKTALDATNETLADVKATVDNFFAEEAAIEGAIDTLKEIATYIATDKEGAADIVARVGALEGKVDVAKVSTAIANAVKGETDRAASAESALSGRIDALDAIKNSYISADAALKAELQKEIDDDIAAAIANLPPSDTTYNFSATENPLEFMVSSSTGEVQTVSLLSPNFNIASNADIYALWSTMDTLGEINLTYDSHSPGVLAITYLAEFNSTITPAYYDIYINGIKHLRSSYQGTDTYVYLDLKRFASYTIQVCAKKGILERYSDNLTVDLNVAAVRMDWSKENSADPDDSLEFFYLDTTVSTPVPSAYLLKHYRNNELLQTLTIDASNNHGFIIFQDEGVYLQTGDIISMTAYCVSGGIEYYGPATSLEYYGSSINPPQTDRGEIVKTYTEEEFSLVETTECE